MNHDGCKYEHQIHENLLSYFPQFLDNKIWRLMEVIWSSTFAVSQIIGHLAVSSVGDIAINEFGKTFDVLYQTLSISAFVFAWYVIRIA